MIVSFSETEKQFVMNKTNAVCLRAMWGDDSGEWAGHKVTLHPVKDESGLSESGLCIRVKGSPELPSPLKFRARLGRKMVTQTLVPTGNGKAAKVDAATGEVGDDFTFDEGPPVDALEAVYGDGSASEGDTGLEGESPAFDEMPEDGAIPGIGAAEYKARKS